MQILKEQFPGPYGRILLGAGRDLLSLTRDEVMPSFRGHHVLLLRGFAADIAAFKAFTSAMTGDFVDYRGGSFKREKIQGDPTLLSVTAAEQRSSIPFHGEMYYKRIRPSVLWFYCDRPPSRLGETTLCDGRELYRSLSARTRDMLERKPLVYRVNYTLESLHEIYESDDLGQIRQRCAEDGVSLHIDGRHCHTEFEGPAVHRNDAGEPCVINNILPMALAELLLRRRERQVRYSDGRRLSMGVVLELLFKSHRLGLAVPWQRHDVLMIDNRTIMHGRRRIADPARKILVRMSN
ncbi:MAG TPA: TauD/TfdA family dioxygenase [Kofleriaceae bacterium]|nr:TauD/TfdA family dioxygenase [Kofleriaceae bacterium]